jgi:hypothetical protein
MADLIFPMQDGWILLATCGVGTVILYVLDLEQLGKNVNQDLCG